MSRTRTHLLIARDDVLLCIEALRDSAYSEAGQSQAPCLLYKEELPEWQLADELERRLNIPLRSAS